MSGAVLRFLWVVPVIHAAGVAGGRGAPPVPTKLGASVVFTQLPAARAARPRAVLPSDYGPGGRLMLLMPDGTSRPLLKDFESAADPDVSFDGKRIVFAGRKTASDHWDIYEIDADGSNLRQITRDLGDCRHPIYQSAIFYLNDPKPLYQVTFVSTIAGEFNEYGPIPASNLYSVRLDGKELRRLTFNVSSSFDPYQMQDGRILFSAWRRHTLDDGGPLGRVDLYGINLDGTDFAAFSGIQGKRIKQMACTIPKRMVVFIESSQATWDGAGSVGALSLRRNLHSYRAVTPPAEGLYHSPSPLPDGSVLISRRPANGTGTHAICRLDPATGATKVVFDDPGFHDVQAKIVAPRPEPDGRSSVVIDSEPNALLYCLNLYTTDFADPKWMPPGSVKRLRVLEGLPRTAPARGTADKSPLLHRRLLGEIDVDDDGSFQIQVPANLPIQLQALDGDGMALRSSAWIWAKNKENRGCIGCHEDGERTPENAVPKALGHPAARLTLAPEKRRTVDFRRDVMPVLAGCANRACHAAGSKLPLKTPETAYRALLAPGGKYVTPGKARTSPLVWSIHGRNTSRPWDRVPAAPFQPMPPAGSKPLTAEEKRAIVEWVDLGAHWDALPAPPGDQQ